MRSSLWAMLVAALGVGLFVRSAVSSAYPPANVAPANAAASTKATRDVLTQLEPLLGMLLMIAGVGTLVTLAFRAG